MTRLRSTARAVALALALALTGPPAAADSPRVLLVRPAAAEASVTDALLRVQGELVADGFDVALIEARPGSTSADAMAAAERDSGSATVGLFLSSDGRSAEVWVVDRLTGKTVVRRVGTASESPERLAEVLAVRAVELLRASLLELAMEERGSTPPAAPPASGDTVRRATRWAARPLRPRVLWAVEVGGGVAWSPGQVKPAVAVGGGLRFELARPLVARLRFVGTATRPRIEGPEGSATVQQSAGIVDLVVRPWPSWPLHPTFSAGAGVLYSQVDGEAAWPYRGLHHGVWAFTSDAGLGCAWRVTPGLEILAEAHAELAMPHPVIRFADREVTTLGRPSLVGLLAIAGSL